MPQQNHFSNQAVSSMTYEHILLIATWVLSLTVPPLVSSKSHPHWTGLKKGDKEGRNPLLVKEREKIIHLLGSWQQEKQKQEKVNCTKGLVYSGDYSTKLILELPYLEEI